MNREEIMIGAVIRNTIRKMLVILMIVSAVFMCGCITIQMGENDATEEIAEPAEGNSEVSAETSEPASETESGNNIDGGDQLLGEDEVLEIVLGRVPGATADEVVSISLEKDDGMWEYEGELLHDGLEYEFEIDAATGNILEWEIDD